MQELAAAAEVADGVERVDSADRPRAKGQAVGVARHDFDESPQCLVTAEDPADPAQIGEMSSDEAPSNPCLFGDRDYRGRSLSQI